jgi:sterol desaturase/sphingolipid hydroxylase (fatty acid hydroxylase superfamily)
LIDFILGNEPLVRLSFFIGVFLVMAFGEVVFPRRSLNVSKTRRWTANLTITFTNGFLVRFIFGAGATGFAIIVQDRGWGVLNIIETPLWLQVAISLIVLDFIIYMQHLIFHHVPLLWRLHKVHHTDLDYDVTTGARFHPFEIMLSMGIKMGAIFFLGAPPISVILFEIALNASAMFNHGNVSLPERADKLIRLVIVTPDMHRVHHSVVIREFNSNFGFSVSWWDRIFGTYKASPEKGHLDMNIGRASHREQNRLNYFYLLAIPFQRGNHIQ